MGDWQSANGRLGAAAKYYAETLGWYILPVHGIDPSGKCTCGKTHKDSREIGKHPVIASWNAKATTDVAQIEAWWAENPDYNIGVFAKPSGFFVLDIDPRNGGNDSFIKLEERAMGNIPFTVEAITGSYYDKGTQSRGRHYIYKCDPNEKFIGNFGKEGLDGIDVKHNGYILVSPSRHASGFTYDWNKGHEPWNSAITEAPEELLSVVRGRKLRTSTGGTGYEAFDWGTMDDLQFAGERLDVEKMLEEGLTEGHRAVGIYQIACGLANKLGVDSDFKKNLVETTMLRFNAEAVKPPMEIEGPNSLLMHTRRAIAFVEKNPKINLYWSELDTWVKSQGAEWAEGAERQFISAKAATRTFEYGGEELTADVDSLPTANAVGRQMASFAAEGRSLADAALGGNLNLPKDADSLSEDAGGREGYRTLSDVGNGRRLIDAFGSGIRYTPNLGWFVWDGNYWKPDPQKMAIREICKMVSTVVASEVANYSPDDSRAVELVKWANSSKSNSRIMATIDQAVSDKRIQVEVTEWDNDPLLLGVKNGVVDLKTGELKSGRPDLHITKQSPVSYNRGLTNIRWEQFLDDATGGDKEYQNWLQKAVGYTLTGLSNQDILFIIYGPPGSGKNTFIESVFEALGTSEYAWSLDPNVLAFNDRANSSDEYHMAQLRGRRMIWVDELPENERIKENQVKKLTGSGTIQGRSPGEKPIQFTSQGKLWISTNHRPIITDEAMWRRIRPVPLMNKPERPDPSLKKYLSDPDGGLPAVLSWAVEGAIKYLTSSEIDQLGWCSVVKIAHDVYKKSEDRIGAFLDEELREDAKGSLLVGNLFRTYKMWTDARGERAISQIAFQRKLTDRGMNVEGNGTKATIFGFSPRIHEVPAAQAVNLGDFARYSSSNI